MTARNGSISLGGIPFLALTLLAAGAALLLAARTASAQIIWDGPPLTFTKLDGADPALPGNQDALVPGVSLTRGNTRGLYNIAVEAFFLRGTSPVDTEWAWTFNNPALPESEIRASNFAALNFDEWTTSHREQPLSTLGRPAVLHIMSQDVYMDLTMTAWTSGPGGGFAYLRSTPPLPPPVPTFGSLGQALGTIAFSICVGLSAQKGRAALRRLALHLRLPAASPWRARKVGVDAT
jgi:hypothetical protein